MDIRTHHRQLQAAADAYSVARFVKSSAVGSLIFGGLALVVGLPGLLDSPINAGLVALGAMLLAGGIWGLSSPSPAGIVYQGVALIVIGAWNLVASGTALAAEPGLGIDAVFLALGCAQIYWAVGCFRRYRRVAGAGAVQASPEAARWAEQAVEGIATAVPKQRGDMVVLVQGIMPWKGWLGGDGAIFVRQDRSDVLIAPPEDVSLTVDRSHGRYAEVRLGIGGRDLRGKVVPEHVRRLEAWLAAATCEPSPQPAAPPVQPPATPPPVPSRHPAGPSVRQEAARVPSWSRFPHPPARSGSAPLRRIVRRPCCGTSGVTPGNFTLR